MAVRVGLSVAPTCASQEAAVGVDGFSRKQYHIGLRAAPNQSGAASLEPFRP
jgi:hypothetical protein